MKTIKTLLVFVLAATNLLSCSTQQSPVEVEKFVERRDICEHLRGEFPDPPNPKRSKEISDGVKEYCTGTDAQLAALKIRYADNPSIAAKLNKYETRIERKK